MRGGSFRLASLIPLFLLVPCLILVVHEKSTAQERAHKEPPTPGPMLAQGTITLDTPEFTLDLVRSSQTVAALKPKVAPEFDFTPGDLLVERSKDGYYHLGDLNLRVRMGNSVDWKNYSTAVARQPVIARSEEHTSELQSPDHLVCRLLLAKKKQKKLSTHA